MSTRQNLQDDPNYRLLKLGVDEIEQEEVTDEHDAALEELDATTGLEINMFLPYRNLTVYLLSLITSGMIFGQIAAACERLQRIYSSPDFIKYSLGMENNLNFTYFNGIAITSLIVLLFGSVAIASQVVIVSNIPDTEMEVDLKGQRLNENTEDIEETTNTNAEDGNEAITITDPGLVK